MFKNCNEYWEQLIKDYVECSDIADMLSKKDIKEIAQQILDDDYLWDSIYGQIYTYIQDKLRERGKK